MARKIKEKELIELSIESIAFEGGGVAKHDGRVFFIKGAVPGDRIIARINKKKKSYSFGEIDTIIEPSSDRIAPICKHFGLCGGCSWQQLKYNKQLYWKRQHVIDSFSRIGKISNCEYLETMPSPKAFHYRNKMEFSFSGFRWLTEAEISSEDDIPNKDFALGLHVPGIFNKVLDIQECYLHKIIVPVILKKIRDKAIELSVKPYNIKTHEGYLRNLVFRSSEFLNELMVILVTTDIKDKSDEEFLDWFKNTFPIDFPDIQHIIHAVNNSFSPVATGELRLIKGSGYLTEKILDVTYRISPFSFFQTNSSQLNGFISQILNFANIKQDEICWDLYCGTGSITLPASSQAKEIYGLELVESSINDANKNKDLNNIENAHFICTDLNAKNAIELLQGLPKPDVIIIDPPRAGMHKNLIPAILDALPNRIVYVSCNPTTQARDCDLLSEKYYVEKVMPVDMFPHTFHVESIAKLIRKDDE
jgi:23S rRNA (uracil1939-C5)-methyltransferase